MKRTYNSRITEGALGRFDNSSVVPIIGRYHETQDRQLVLDREKSGSAPSKRVPNFLRPLAIAEVTSDDAIAYAHIRAKLERAGTPIGPLDTLIASQAVARELTLVSNNEREFRRVPGLHLESWAR